MAFKKYHAAINICSIPHHRSLEVLSTEMQIAKSRPLLDEQGCYLRVTGYRPPHLLVACNHRAYLEDFLRRYHGKNPQENVSEMLTEGKNHEL